MSIYLSDDTGYHSLTTTHFINEFKKLLLVYLIMCLENFYQQAFINHIYQCEKIARYPFLINDFIKRRAIEKNGRETINSITVNAFRGSSFTFDELRHSKYILCTTSGLYGLDIEFTDGVASKFIMHDLCAKIPNMMDSSYEFIDCQFISIGESSTMVVVCIDSNG